MSRTRKPTRPRFPLCSCGSRHAFDTFACHSVEPDDETRATGNVRTYEASYEASQEARS